MSRQLSSSVRLHLAALALAAPLAFAAPLAAQGGVAAFGLPHTALGGAVLTPGSTGGLVVSNIGSSGQDGVEIALGDSQGWDGWFTPSAIPANGSLEYTFIGSGPTVTHMPGSGLRVTRQGTDYLLEVGFETVSSVTLDAYLDGVPVYHATQHTGTDWIWVPIALYILAHTDAHVEWKTGDGCSGGVSWNGPTAIQIPAGPMITCDLLVARPENSTLVFDSVEAVQIKGANLAPFTLTEERVGVLDHSVTALGQAALMPVGGNLMVSNLGSSGQDGVAIHPRVLAGRTLDGISIALAALDPGGQAPLGATFTASATGVLDGIPSSALGSGTFTKVPGGLQLDVDYSAVGATSHIIEIYDHGVLQVSIAGHTGPIANLQGWPTGCGKRFWPIVYPPLWCLWFDFVQSQLFTILGSTGGSFSGDEIRVLAEGSPHTISTLDSFALSGGDLAGIGVVGMADTSATGNYFGTGCPGSSGLTATNRMGRLPILGTTVPLHLDGLPPGGFAFYVLAFSQLPSPFPLPGAPGCFQYLPLGVTVLVIANGAGSATFNQGIPADPSLIGLPIFAQGAALDLPANTLGVTTTNGLFLGVGL